MLRTLSALFAGAAIGAVGLMSAAAQEPKRSERPEIPGGIEGQVKSVDPEKHTLSITTPGGRVRTFTITEDTTMLGPRGGKVRHRLRDPRFREAIEITVVADGNTAKELHLGFRHRAHADSANRPTSSAKPGISTAAERPERAPADAVRPKASSETRQPAANVGTKAAAHEEEEDEDDEIPGRVKSYDANRRLLVVSLLNGKSRSFFLSRDVKVLVRGTPSRQGLSDPALKADVQVTVLLEPGGRRVRELHVGPAPAARSKKAA
jgi:hypothetical protein